MDRSASTPSTAVDAVADAFACGQEGSLAEVYRHYGDLVYTFCCRTLEESRAGDVTQEVFISAWKHRQRFDPAKGTLAGWLIAIAKNRIIDNVRAENRHAARRSDQDPTDVPADSAIERIAERLLISDALRRLPEQSRRLVTMHYFDGLTHRQIAEQTSLPLGTVKSTLLRALVTIRCQLERSDG
ncbi:RNA polymerase sigma factor [Candidatus Poriferisodalis sp.]|uniref:RNA polymerase sigma factor n=1 Tax=Candidatus Poriferisodalis sp. TaxID=3101277 RepID=UPI003B0104D4